MKSASVGNVSFRSRVCVARSAINRVPSISQIMMLKTIVKKTARTEIISSNEHS